MIESLYSAVKRRRCGRATTSESRPSNWGDGNSAPAALPASPLPGRDRIEDRGSIPQNGDFALFDAMSPVSSVKRYIAGSATTSGRHALAAWFAHGDFASIASHSWRHSAFLVTSSCGGPKLTLDERNGLIWSDRVNLSNPGFFLSDERRV